MALYQMRVEFLVDVEAEDVDDAISAVESMAFEGLDADEIELLSVEEFEEEPKKSEEEAE